MIRRLAAAAALAVAASSLAGCEAVAHSVWPCPPVPERPPCALTRDTPDHAVDFLIDAFRNRRVGDIFASFHPDFIHENGDFSQADFQVAYEHYEEDFTADARSLITATRAWAPPMESPWGLIRAARMTNVQTGASVVFALKNRPKIRIVTSDRFVRTIEGPVDKAALVKLENGHMLLPADFDLRSIENVQAETVAGLKGSDVVRLEFTDDWVVRLVPQDSARNIRFMDKIKELTRK